MPRRTRHLSLSTLGVALLAVLFLACSPGGREAEKAGPTGKAATPADSAAGKAIFDAKCVACHSIGQGKRIGPDLAGVTKIRSTDWLTRWIKDPTSMLASDETAKKLLAEWNNVPMPNLGLTDEEVANVIAFLDSKKDVATGTAQGTFEELDEASFARAKEIFFNRCAGCHGTLRAGATGPNIQPKRTREIGTDGIIAILNNGLPGGMPAWGRAGILSQEEIRLMANYVQMEPPTPPQLPMEKIRESWSLKVPVAERPAAPVHKRNWENYMGVILRDAGKVAFIDGDTKELVGIVDTGFAVHILRSSSSGRYSYAVGRDGRVTMIDLWTETPQLVAQVQGCFDARSVDASKYEGYEDKLVIEGCYWPPQYVVFDGQTLEPKKVVDVLTPTYDTNEKLDEVRVASIVASHYDPLWVVNLKESGHVALVDYSKEGFPMTVKIPAERFLHDGGWDHTKRYFMVAANMRNQMVVVDVKEKKMVAKFETGTKPHPGRGANWEDPEYGWVNATTHIGEGKLTVYGADPVHHPEVAWKVVREVTFDGTGSLFLKTHPKSPWVWMDTPLSNVDDQTRQVCVYSKKEAKVVKCMKLADHGRAVHFEYNKAGDEMWVSIWDKKGEIVIFDDATLKEKQRIVGDWLVTPTGKFNVYNTAHDIY